MDDINEDDIRKQVGEYIFGEGKPFKSLIEKVSEEFGNRQLNNKQKKELKEILKFLSIISQYELPVREETLAEYLGLSVDDVEKYLEPLVNYGDIVKIKRQDFISNSYMVPHSKLAELLANILVDSEEGKLDVCKFYIQFDDYPGSLLHRIFWSRDTELFYKLLKILSNNNFGTVFNHRLSFVEIFNMLSCIALTDKKDLFLKALSDNIEKISFNLTELNYLTLFLRKLRRLNGILAGKFLEVNKGRISSLNSYNNVYEIGSLLTELSLNDKEDIAWDIVKRVPKLQKDLEELGESDLLNFWYEVSSQNPKWAFKFFEYLYGNNISPKIERTICRISKLPSTESAYREVPIKNETYKLPVLDPQDANRISTFTEMIIRKYKISC